MTCLSHDPQVRIDYENDPLTHDQVSLKLANDFLSIGEDMLKRSYMKYDLPIYISHGTEDVLTSLKASKEFIGKIPSTNKHLEVYEGAYHERISDLILVHFDSDKEKVVKGYIDWINKNL